MKDPTPESAPRMHAAANESIYAVFQTGCEIEAENVRLRKVAEKAEALMDNIRRNKIQMAVAPWFQLKRALADLTTPDQPIP